MHFRGPLKLKQFAVYTPSGSSSKKSRRNARRNAHLHNHAHAHAHKREADAAVGDIVTATIDGNVVSWTNEYSGLSTSAAGSSVSSSSAADVTGAPDVKGNYFGAPSSGLSSATATITGSSPSSSSVSEGSIGSTTGGWSRQAYYDASSGSADGLVFLNHNGGSGSGVFDYTFGNSLSYSSSDGCSGASSPTVLEDCQLPSDAEVVIMSDQQCQGDDCGFYRDGTTAYHGFDGAEKAFFFEFQMPDDGQTSSNKYDPVNMPAIWMLNAQIPRTLQYGNADCSCWTSGCGEFDIFEVLAPGDTRCKSTLHGNIQGGDSDYFDRPVDSTIKAAMVLYDNNIHIKILDNNTNFGSSMDADTLNDICGSTLTQSKLVSLFQLAS